MYKILVVEDDVLIRRVYPVVINWERLGFCIAGMVDNGLEALEFLQREAVDVVLTDICMPVLNGIELAGEIKTNYPGIKTVILSAYSEFDYAKKAIDCGVYSYLLKENEYHEISECFRRIREELDQERQAEAAAFKTDGEKLSEWFQKMKDNINASDGARTENGWVLGAVAWDNPEEIPEQNKKAVCGNIRDVLEQKLNGTLWVCETKILFLFGAEQEDDGFLFFSKEIEAAEEAFSVYWYGVVHNGQEADIGLSELKRWMEKRFFLAGRCMITGIPKTGPREKEDILSVRVREKEKRLLLNAMNSGNDEALAGEIRNLKRKLCCPMQYSAIDVQFFVKGLYMELMRYSKNAQKAKERIGEMDLCTTLQSLMRVLQDACYESMEEEKKNRESGRIVVSAAVAYMEEHFREPLTLKQIAEESHVHPNYFSWLFLNETGIHFIDLLTQLRLKEAQRLLCETDKKIYEIAEEIGYHKPRYFSELFKKHTGYTPYEYREKYGE